ncbi:MAG: hypothetical protein ABL958_08035 [Bdellovibrionia bacterium]
MNVDASHLFRPIVGSPNHGIKNPIWVLRQAYGLDPYWKEILKGFLDNGCLPKDIYEAIASTDRTHVVEHRKLQEIFDFDGESFQILRSASRAYYEVEDKNGRALFTGANLEKLKDDIKRYSSEQRIEKALTLRRCLRQIFDLKKGSIYFDQIEKDKIQASEYYGWSVDKIRDAIKGLEQEIKRVSKLSV